ncbi:OmpA family protein [Leptospira sp. 2 VSF19]|uniref:OmpA family protein n=1 Tax=Leptospira soteropolitanensis TaxID=2950025 RepID=A0AAW5VDP9_9LEPT|nr:OmpA family protein [Leptospira soteropolitanensis]MCW7491793.1 OmpA family protein [Leptospira soteropolitanensis]MCW7499377.1 OmpA family protein [Leptospira soteropolitanensis]MCW7521032.1 OmpA family protein [Leptospira soteropolitanensis]MCW7525481.1 OmpA family protein [Leptospira soteropolitanensis]MCW7529347.1 OmpA family protein [Leptospira soteropolitanensis]
MADSYYRTISGKHYDNELLEIVEKATKRSKAPIGKNIAKTLFDAIKDGGDYTDVEKRTVKYIRDNFKFNPEADEFLRSEIRKWAAKISVPAAKKKSSAKSSAKKESAKKRSSVRSAKASDEGFTPYVESYEFGESSREEIAPTPEYNELVALNKFQITPRQNRIGRIVLLGLIAVFFIVLIIFGIRSCNRSSNSSQNTITSQNSNLSQDAGSRSLERVELSQGKVSSRFESRASAIRYINDLQIRFIKQSMQTEDGASDKIATLAEALKAYPGIRVRVKGHTCFIGEMDENKILSDERAKFIFDELVKNGVSSTQLDYRGFGETAEIESNSTEAGRIKNRRVDFTVLSVTE